MVEFRFGDCPPDCIVAASQTTSWVTARGGQMYSFGKLKKTGDCAMYPVPFYDLQGWGLRSVACGQAIYAAAGDDQAITWGQGSDLMALKIDRSWSHVRGIFGPFLLCRGLLSLTLHGLLAGCSIGQMACGRCSQPNLYQHALGSNISSFCWNLCPTHIQVYN